MDKKEAYASPFGHWQVTTEGDCEGRTTKNLGTFTGYIDEIALGLADKCHYSLTFEAVPAPTTVLIPTGKSVNVSLPVGITYGMKSADAMSFYQNLFKSRPNIKVSECSYFNSFTLSDPSIVTEKEREEQVIDKVKGTLSAEEFELLQKRLK